MIQRIDPPLPLLTPRGPAHAHFVIDYGVQFDLLWVCFQDETGECRTYGNRLVRMGLNETMGWGVSKDAPVDETLT